MLVQVFRCLAGLWSIDTGSITKPGGGKALAGKVFYLPQKPYQVLGTLFDQISYPAAHDPAHLTEEIAGEILDEVELGDMTPLGNNCARLRATVDFVEIGIAHTIDLVQDTTLFDDLNNNASAIWPWAKPVIPF